ncbi:oxidoreductase [Ketobacter sp. MCCC 1A13808]|uniref:acyl-CoA dehydrogenase family protein n=1 Tax=Ketobacter sp. MCCC 1A13808 TaxID=2602738 RepID=UPI0012EB33AC|nr:acyl-CoA dehydrogenase family protein [Ketobacter sp. MCCC 1A13808]MVF10614.1 oxidoreductase [Ketobacter sp. MCCC 1A13808]
MSADQSASFNECFDITLTAEQRMTRESLRRFARAEIQSIARASDEAGQPPAEFFNRIAELGLSLMPIPEALGGAGMIRSPVSNMLNAEDLGKGDMSLAIAALTPSSFINVLLDQASERQQEKYLTPLANERFQVATIALMEPRATFDAADIRTKAFKVATGYCLNGEKTMVALAAQARFILVLAADENNRIAGFIVDGDSAGLRVTDEHYMGLRPLNLSRVTLKDVQVGVDARIELDIRRLTDLSAIGLSAVTVGCCEAVLDYVVPYVNERTAFGEPVSHRQSVAFMVADMATELEAMRMLVYRAASRAEQGLPFHEQAYWCRIFCAEKSMEIGTNGIQLLGGHGFIREHPVEMFYRNLRAHALLQGVVVV